MLPILVISSSQKDLETFIEANRQEHKIPPHAVLLLQPEKDDLTIGQIREVRKETILHHPHLRLFVLKSFDKANGEAQNALLKTLEEKNERNLFVLTAEQIEKVLPTIRSRTRIVNLNQNNQTQLISAEVQSLMQHIKTHPSTSFLSHPLVLSINRERAIQLLTNMISVLQTDLPNAQSATVNTLKKTLEVLNYLQDNNLNPQLAVDTVLLYYFKQLHYART